MVKLVKLAICAALCSLLLTIPAQAHPGRTDSNGGHYNHSTGEYHYHHGYSAHDHYDMDGDGKADCPYTFKGKTESEGGQGVSISDIVLYIIIASPIAILVWAFVNIRTHYDSGRKK